MTFLAFSFHLCGKTEDDDEHFHGMADIIKREEEMENIPFYHLQYVCMSRFKTDGAKPEAILGMRMNLAKFC